MCEDPEEERRLISGRNRKRGTVRDDAARRQLLKDLGGLTIWILFQRPQEIPEGISAKKCSSDFILKKNSLCGLVGSGLEGSRAISGRPVRTLL